MLPSVTMTRAKTSKAALKRELLALLKRQLETSERSQRDAHAGAIHEEAKAEDDKDTRALELSYLARGQATRVTELHEALGAIEALKLSALREGDSITVGALVLVEDEDGETQTLFLLPHGAGNKLAKGTVQIATLRSPLGEALLGRHAGDSVEVPRGKAIRELSIVAVR